MFNNLKPLPEEALLFAYCIRLETSPRNIEAAWNPFYDNRFRRQINRINDPNFSCVGQFPLTLRNANEDPFQDDDPPMLSTKLLGELQAASNEEESEEEFSDDDDVYEDSPLWSRTDPSYRGRKVPSVGEVRRSTREAVLPSVPAPVTPPRNVQNKPPKKIGTDGSQPAKRNVDRYFLVDYALLALSAAHKDAMPPTKNLMGFTDISAACDSIPVVIELKAAIKRESDPKRNAQVFGDRIRYKLREGLDDILLKHKAVFRSNATQVSMVGIAISGPWWAFTILNKNDPAPVLSQAFVCCSVWHNTLLSTIFDAAAQSPADPCAYNEGILIREFKRFSAAPESNFAPLNT